MGFDLAGNLYVTQWTGDYEGGQAVWASRPLPSGTPLSPPTPVFKKLDESVVEEELSRLEEHGTSS